MVLEGEKAFSNLSTWRWHWVLAGTRQHYTQCLGMHGGCASKLSSVSLSVAWKASAPMGTGGIGLVGPGRCDCSMGNGQHLCCAPVGKQRALMSHEEITILPTAQTTKPQPSCLLILASCWPRKTALVLDQGTARACMPSCTKPGKHELLSLVQDGDREYKCMLIVSNLRPTSAAILEGQRVGRKRGNENQLVSVCGHCCVDIIKDKAAQVFRTHLSLDAGCICRSLEPWNGCAHMHRVKRVGRDGEGLLGMGQLPSLPT